MKLGYPLLFLAWMTALISLALPAFADSSQPAPVPNTDTNTTDQAAGAADQSNAQDQKDAPQYVVIPLSDGGASWWHGRLVGPPKDLDDATAATMSQNGDVFSGPLRSFLDLSDGGASLALDLGNVGRPLLWYGTPVSINNNGDILFESGDIYHWDGSEVAFARHTHGPQIPQAPPAVSVNTGSGSNSATINRLPATTGAGQQTQVEPAYHLPSQQGFTDGPFFWGHAFGIDDSGNVAGWMDEGLYTSVGGDVKLIVPTGWYFYNPDDVITAVGPTPGWIAENGHGQIITQTLIPSGAPSGPGKYVLSPPLFIQNGQVEPLENALAAIAAASPALPDDQSGEDSKNAEGAPDADSPAGAKTHSAAPKKPKEFPTTPWPASLTNNNWALDPWDINDSGHVAGALSPVGNPAHNRHAALLSGNKMVLLMPLDGSDISVANGVNDKDDAVGYVYRGYVRSTVSAWDGQKENNAIKEARATLWKDGRMYDLNDLVPKDSGWFLVSATHINNKGEIVGIGVYSHGPSAHTGIYPGISCAFLLVPTSEFSKDKQPGATAPSGPGDAPASAGDTEVK